MEAETYSRHIFNQNQKGEVTSPKIGRTRARKDNCKDNTKQKV